MTKKITFAFMFLFSAVLFSQGLELRDKNNNSVEGRTFYFYDTPMNLSVTSMYVGNTSSSAITFDAVMRKVTNPSTSDWQVCYGSQCYTANNNTSGNQYFSDPAGIAPANSFYNGFKPAPFSFGWSTGDWGKWYVSVINSANSADSSGACVIWTAGGTFAGDVNSNKIVDANELAGDMNLNGIIDGAEMLGDMDGSGTIDECEMHGDANGNGIIDGSEVALSIDELALNVASVKAFPNPVSSQLTIKYNLNDLSISDIAQIEIFDIVGKKKEDIILNKGKTQLNLDVTNYNSGIYFYSLNVNGKTLKTERIMVK